MLTVTGYEWLKFGHVLSAVVWVGGSAMLTILGIRASRSTSPERILAFTRETAWVGRFVFTPATFALLGFGSWAVENGGLDWGST